MPMAEYKMMANPIIQQKEWRNNFLWQLERPQIAKPGIEFEKAIKSNMSEVNDLYNVVIYARIGISILYL